MDTMNTQTVSTAPIVILCSRSCFYTSKPLQALVCVFYGLFKRNLLRQKGKLRHCYLSVIFVTLQWLSVCMYAYCIKTYWTTNKRPRIPAETIVVMVALNTSAAVSSTFAVMYFYSTRNNFRDGTGKGFSLIPNVSFRPKDDKEVLIALSDADWLLVNTLFILGIIGIAGVFTCAFAFNTFFDFTGIHDFTSHITGGTLGLYYCALVAVYWGFCATVCACCLFHVVSRDLINHIDYTEKLIITSAKDRIDFFSMHESLLRYTKSVMSSLKYWFAMHNIFFIFLVLAMIFEWINAIKRSEQHWNVDVRIWVAQFAGSSLIAYKFAFPFISASRVTARFGSFYYNVARQCKVFDLPDLVLLSEYSGFKLFGFRITTSVALIAMVSSFIGALKFIADFYYKT